MDFDFFEFYLEPYYFIGNVASINDQSFSTPLEYQTRDAFWAKVELLALLDFQNIEKLFKAATICSLRESAFFYTVFGSNMISSKVILLKHLKKMLDGMLLFKMKVNQGFQMIIEGHLKRPVDLRLEHRHVDHRVMKWFKKMFKFDCLTIFLKFECMSYL